VALKGSTTIVRRVVQSLRHAGLVASVLAATAMLCVAQSAPLASAPVLRVCADPDNLPFSNDKGEGFENKLAVLLAERLGQELEYTWSSEDSGDVSNTVGEGARTTRT